jgi:HK97 family phage portal protein
MGLFSWFRRSGMANQYLRNDNFMIPRWTRPPERNTAEWIKMFSKSPRLAVVNRIASDLSFATGKLYQIDDGGEEHELTAHPFLDFWEKINPLYEYSSAALWQLHEIYLLLKGEGYFVIERDILGYPCELWPVPTHWVFMTPYLGFPYYRIRTSSGAILEIPVEDMFIMKSLNPSDPFMRGLGEAESVADEVETDEYASKFQKRFFFNDATPNLVISMPGSSDEQRKRFRSEWLERFKGIFKSHGVATTDGDISINKIGESMKDMDMVNGRVYLRDAVLEHFGVPREIMGITENSNRATAEAAQFIYAQNVLTPRLQRREEAVNNQLLPAFGDNLVWRYDNIIPRNQEFDKLRALDGWNAGLLTKDEARELLDHEPATNGAIYKTTFSDIFISEKQNPVEVSSELTETEQGAPGSMPGEEIEVVNDGEKGAEIEITDTDDGDVDFGGLKAAETGRGHKAVTTDATVARNMQALRAEQERKNNIAITKYFNTQKSQIARVLSAHRKADIHEGVAKAYTAWDSLFGVENALIGIELSKTITLFVDNIFDWKSENDVLKNLFTGLETQTYNASAKVTASLYRLRDTTRPEFIRIAQSRIDSRIKEITSTTKASIADSVSRGLESGKDKAEVVKEIQDCTAFSPGRSQTIANTETHIAIGTGVHDSLIAAGFTRHKWVTKGDSKVRDRHQKINGEIQPISEVFSNGLIYPGDPSGPPGEIVNCRCIEVGVP